MDKFLIFISNIFKNKFLWIYNFVLGFGMYGGFVYLKIVLLIIFLIFNIYFLFFNKELLNF